MRRIQSDLGRIQSDLGRIQLGEGRIQSDWGRIQLGLRVKFQSGALDIFNGGVKNPIEKIRRGYCVRVNEGIGGMEKGVNGGI